MNEEKKKGTQGFASIKKYDPEKQKRIALMGGKAAHAKGTGHEWTREEAREAGRKGGKAFHKKRAENKEKQDASSVPS